MTEKVNPKTEIAYQIIDDMLKKGYVTTESSQRRVDTLDDNDWNDNSAVYECLERIEKMLATLCQHLGVEI